MTFLGDTCAAVVGSLLHGMEFTGVHGWVAFSWSLGVCGAFSLA